MIARRVLYVFAILFCIAWLVRGCGGDTPRVTYRIARDVTWYPLRVGMKEKNLVAFSDDLIRQVGRDSGARMVMVAGASSQLMTKLHRGEYEAAMGPLADSEQNRARYDYSSLYFRVSPVLVVPINSKVSSLEDLVGKTVGIGRDTPTNFGLVRDGLVTITPFDNMVVALDSLLRGELQAVIMDSMYANTLVYGPYSDRLKIGSDHLTEDGLRLIALKGKHTDLIEQFDATVRLMRADGRYQQLLRKWALNQEKKID